MPLTESPTLEPDESSYLFRRYWTVNSLHYTNLVLSLFKLSNYKEIRNAERNLKKSINQLFRLTQKKIKHRNTLRLSIFSKIRHPTLLRPHRVSVSSKVLQYTYIYTYFQMWQILLFIFSWFITDKFFHDRTTNYKHTF